jgi:DNA-binding transcriptional MerR regulator
MMRIGDFARLSGVSITALRHYDAVGLLSPHRVDATTGYRYYAVSQLARLHRLLAYRDLGFSLTDARGLLDRELESGILRRALLEKRAELRRRVEREQTQLARVEHLLQTTESNGRTLEHHIVIKDLEARTVAGMRSRLVDYSELEPLLCRLTTAVRRVEEGSALGAVWHRCARSVHHGQATTPIDCEAVAFLARGPVEVPGCRVFELPAARVAAVVHSDAEELTPAAYDAIADTVNACGYEIAWPMREVYFRGEEGASTAVVEARFPLRRTRHPD